MRRVDFPAGKVSDEQAAASVFCKYYRIPIKLISVERFEFR